jgi:hypothetical protein
MIENVTLGAFYAGNRLRAFPNPENSLILIQGRGVLKRKSKLAIQDI